MRLLLITNRCPCDADDPASPFVPHFVRALRETGVEIDVLTPRYTHRPQSAEPEYIHRFETGALAPVGSWNLASPVNWWRLYRFLSKGLSLGRRLCREHQYDHILALWALPSGEFARRLSAEFHIPYSVWCLGSDIYSWGKRPVVRGKIGRVLHGAAHLFGDGHDLCNRVRAWIGRECAFLPSFRPIGASAQFAPPRATTAPRFLYLGRLHRDKGVTELVGAFAEVHRSLDQATLRFVGDGPDRIRLIEKAIALGLSDQVEFCGVLGHDKIIAAYQSCDAVVIPTKSDSLPLVFSEAVQCCRPVIGTDVGDLGTFIRQYGVGIVCESAEPALLARAMLAMAQSPVFSMSGRAELLKLLDPKVAAGAFCERVFGAGAFPHIDSESSRATVSDDRQPVNA